MLIPIEAIAVILYLANFSIIESIFSLNKTIQAILLTILFCMLFSALQTFIILLRGKLYTHKTRQIIKICSTSNKIISTISTLALFENTHAENIYQFFLPKLQSYYILSNISGMLIFILITAATWLPWYYIHNKTNPSNWSLPAYMLHKFRYTFFILGLWLPGLLITEYFSNNPTILQNPNLGIYSMLFLLLIAWIFPFFLKKFWGCKDLKNNELKEEIDKLTEKANVNIKQICSWRLGGNSIPNAAMVGFLPPFRYLFISTGLLKKVDKEEILGIIGHEIGHLKKQHILFYLYMSISLLSTIEPLIYNYINNHITAILVIISFFAFYIRFIFGWFSRRFEREADLFSAELLNDHRPLSRGLEELGIICGNIRNDSSWHHYGIAERVLFLRKSAENTQYKNSFKRNLFMIKTASIIVFSLLLYYSFIIPVNTEKRKYSIVQISAQKQTDTTHWLRVSKIIPDDIKGPENLLKSQLYKLNSEKLTPLEIALILEKAEIYANLAKSRTDSAIRKNGYDLQLGAIEYIGRQKLQNKK